MQVLSLGRGIDAEQLGAIEPLGGPSDVQRALMTSCLGDHVHPPSVIFGFPRSGVRRKMRAMAVLLQLTVAPATQEQFDQLDARVGQSMAEAGGPPAGLMSHVVYPRGEGFVVADVWRTESEGQPYVDEVLRPLLSELGLTATDSAVLPVWSFARP